MFLTQIALVDFDRTMPASSMQKPMAIANTRAPFARNDRVLKMKAASSGEGAAKAAAGPNRTAAMAIPETRNIFMRFSDTSPELRSHDEERRQANARLRSDSGLDDHNSVTTPSNQQRLYGGRAAEQLVAVDRGFAAGGGVSEREPPQQPETRIMPIRRRAPASAADSVNG